MPSISRQDIGTNSGASIVAASLPPIKPVPKNTEWK
jgi:hypothetical protein